MSKRSPEGELLTDLILETFRLNGVLLQAGNNLTKPYGLTSARWQVMGAIDQEGHALTVAQIARRMGLSRQAVLRVVKDLVNLDMLVLEDNVDHKRAHLVLLTDKGSKAMAKVMESQAAWVNELAAGKSQRSIKQALSIMQSIRESLDES